ncbi:MAG: endonuclease MutS2 [Melioribacteraceae bacterium]|nr:endonuclease MutS2 [Melioribacteraceae bacterium]
MITQNVLDKLEFKKVIALIEKYCITEPGRELITNIFPLTDHEIIRINSSRLNSAREILIKTDDYPLGYLPNLFEALSKSRVLGTILTIKEILAVLNLAESSRKMFQFLQKNEAKEFDGLTQNLFIDKVFEHQIGKVFTETGDVRDDASPKLRQIRIDIREKEALLRKVVQKMLKSLSDSYLVQEEYLTLRDGRIVLPVKAEHKRHVKGFIHSESSTGQTVYIEPEETLELNNDILSLSFAEKREIEKILRDITERIGLVSEQLKSSLRSLAEIDSLFARAKYAIEIIGSNPSFNEKKPFVLMDARHPLLLSRIGFNKTVPMNITMDSEYVVLITGPNAGGKTVTIKTAGLLVCMAQSCIPIPVHPDSNFHLFEKVLVDIGDDQSIEDDLSTFSSHLKNIKNILNEVDDKSLVLLDEIGTGTDPSEGSALAAGILISLYNKRARTIATTHHGNLKVLAHNSEGFQNASMEFNTVELKPTYKFNQGMPGSSYAFEVANRIGFNEEFILLAKEHLDSDKTKVEDFLVSLEKKSKTLREQLNKAEIENLRLKSLANLYQEKIEKLENQKKEILLDAKSKANLLLKDVNRQIEDAIKNIKESNAKKEVIREEKIKIDELKKQTKSLIDDVKLEPETVFKEGDYAAVKDTSTVGVISEVNQSKNKAVLSVGSIKLTVKLSDLISAKKNDEKILNRSSLNYQSEAINYRLDLRGMRGDEAEFEVLKFLDGALINSIDRVEILHGKGTGVLKQIVHSILKTFPHIKNYYYADIEYGGEGITIVEFK